MAEIPGDEREIQDADVLNALDLTRRDLGGVRRTLDAGDLASAKGALVEHFRVRQRPRWFFDARTGRRKDVPSSWSGPDAVAVRRADHVLKNRFHLTGDKLWDFGKDLKWYIKEMRGLASPPSIFKRCNWMRDLATAYARTGRSVYAAKFAALVDRWFLDWPLVVDRDFGPRKAIFSRPDGHKAMPTAFRVVSWLDCLYGGIVFAPEVSVETAFGLIRSIWFTALQYRRYETSPYVPANHHLWERGTAPFVFGMMLPEFPEVVKLVEQGRPVIAKHVKHSFLSDGGYEERSTGYTIASFSMFTRPLKLATLNRVSLLNAEEKARLKRCAENMALITLPTGAPPDIGDGRPVVSSNARSMGISEGLFKSRVAADVVNRLGLKRYVDPEDREALKGVKPQKLPLVVHQPASGYFVARDAWTPRASGMALSTPGPGLPNHAHDDALSLQLVVRGEEMVGTPMTELYSYLNKEEIRKKPIRGHFYAMTSHNVVLVGGEPARSIAELTERWGPEPTPVRTEVEEDDGGVRVMSSHKGYEDVRLSRQVNFQYRKGWTVVDRVKGGEGKPHVARWHFEYGVEVEETEDGFVATRRKVRLGVCVNADGRVKTRLYRDNRWLGRNPLRRGEVAPWVLDVGFGGTGDDALETRFEILKGSRRGIEALIIGVRLVL